MAVEHRTQSQGLFPSCIDNIGGPGLPRDNHGDGTPFLTSYLNQGEYDQLMADTGDVMKRVLNKKSSRAGNLVRGIVAKIKR